MNTAVHDEVELATTAKLIGDLDGLIRALLSSLKQSSPSDGPLVDKLRECDRAMEVLRLLIILERADIEILAAAEALTSNLASVSLQAGRSRAGNATKAALRLASGMANQIRSLVRGCAP